LRCIIKDLKIIGPLDKVPRKQFTTNTEEQRGTKSYKDKDLRASNIHSSPSAFVRIRL